MPPTDSVLAPLPPASPPVAPASGAGSTAFLAANRQVLETTESIRALLAAAKDDTSARNVAEKLPALTSRWETDQKAATALFLTLSADQQRQAMSQGQQEAVSRAQPGQEDLIASIQRIAASPQRTTVEPALVKFRDTLLGVMAHREWAARRRQAPLGRRQVAAIPFRPRVARA